MNELWKVAYIIWAIIAWICGSIAIHHERFSWFGLGLFAGILFSIVAYLF